MPLVEVRFSASVPLPATPVTGTVQVMPSLLVGVPTTPVPSVPASAKLPALTPVTAALKLTVKLSLAARVSAAPPRLIATTVGAATAVRLKAWVKLLPPASVTWIST